MYCRSPNTSTLVVVPVTEPPLCSCCVLSHFFVISSELGFSASSALIYSSLVKFIYIAQNHDRSLLEEILPERKKCFLGNVLTESYSR